MDEYGVAATCTHVLFIKLHLTPSVRTADTSMIRCILEVSPTVMTAAGGAVAVVEQGAAATVGGGARPGRHVAARR